MNTTCLMAALGRDITGAMDHGLPVAETVEQVCRKPPFITQGTASLLKMCGFSGYDNGTLRFR